MTPTEKPKKSEQLGKLWPEYFGGKPIDEQRDDLQYKDPAGEELAKRGFKRVNTPTKKPKSAEEVADWIMRQFFVQFGYASSSNKDEVALIAKALNDFAAERVQEACLSDKKIEFIGNLVKQSRAEALEEAAKVVGKDAQCLPYCNSDGHEDKCPVVFPDAAIRALKDTPPK